MFTGIINAVGRVATLAAKGDGLRLYVETGRLNLFDVKLGDSIAVNGVCLTVVDLPGEGFWADVSHETLKRTTMGKLRVGSSVNLEKAMVANDRFGGHIVSGHVDGIGKIVERKDEGRFTILQVRVPDELKRYIAVKGSISIDGVSLTVNGVENVDVRLTIVPHTLQETAIGEYGVGKPVNIEVDMLARYLERLMDVKKETEQLMSGIDTEFLEKYGFVNPTNNQ